MGERSRSNRKTRVLRAHNWLGSVSASLPTPLPPQSETERISETGVANLCVAAQTLGEEYTDIWQSTTRGVGVSKRRRLALILLPTLPVYVAAKLNVQYPPGDSTLGKVRKSLPTTLEIAGEVNLALFYLRGVYYGLLKRVLGIRYVCDVQPHALWISGLRTPFFPAALIGGRKSRQSTTVLFSLGNLTCHKTSLSTHFLASVSKSHCRSPKRSIGGTKANHRRSKRAVGGILG